MTFNNLVPERSISSSIKIPVTTKEEVNMKKIVLITLLGLCSLVFAESTQYDIDQSIKPFNTVDIVSDKQIECLARNMYFEAKNEPEAGIRAVGFVTMNRVSDPHFPKTICGVVHQKERKVCQFSWVCTLGRNAKINNFEAFNRIKEMAREIVMLHGEDHIEDPTKGSLFFHATYITPNWKLKRTVKIGQHVFYKRPVRKN